MLYCGVWTPEYIEHSKPEKIIRVQSLGKKETKISKLIKNVWNNMLYSKI
jgi:hypothetical protein